MCAKAQKLLLQINFQKQLILFRCKVCLLKSFQVQREPSETFLANSWTMVRVSVPELSLNGHHLWKVPLTLLLQLL